MPRDSILTAIIQLERWTPVDILANQRIDDCIRTSFLLPTSYFLLPTSYFRGRTGLMWYPWTKQKRLLLSYFLCCVLQRTSTARRQAVFQFRGGFWQASTYHSAKTHTQYSLKFRSMVSLWMRSGLSQSLHMLRTVPLCSYSHAWFLSLPLCADDAP